jgi:hypothetical protein
MQIRNRIKELRHVRAGDLRPHPKNWRKHPEAQQNALRGILAEVSYVDALMVRELPDGSLQIVDGHLRAETTPDAMVPVLVVDLNDAEAEKVLATFDPLAAMAEPDEAQLEALLKGIETDSDALAALLDDLAMEAQAGIGVAVTEDDVPEPPDEAITKPGDLIILGNHRLLCGDSSKPEDVDRLLDGQTIHLVNTDPPYNVKVEPRSNNAIAAGLSSFTATHHQGLKRSSESFASEMPSFAVPKRPAFAPKSSRNDGAMLGAALAKLISVLDRDVSAQFNLDRASERQFRQLAATRRPAIAYGQRGSGPAARTWYRTCRGHLPEERRSEILWATSLAVRAAVCDWQVVVHGRLRSESDLRAPHAAGSR